MKVYDITPVPAPRMTRSDKWKKRPCVVRYFEFRDRVKELGMEVNSKDFILFEMPMPQSWSLKKKERMAYKPHTQKSDIDNLIKSVLDSIYKDDAHIHTIAAAKIWAYDGAIIVFPNAIDLASVKGETTI